MGNSKEYNGYNLSRAWFDFAFENTDRVSGNHTGIYLWAVELNNRLGWVSKFSFPASHAMMANGIKSYNTYIKVFRDLVEWVFIKVIQEAKNQWTACIIAISKNNKALDKALDKALATHTTKQSESTRQSTDSIIKPINNKTNKQENIYTPSSDFLQFQEWLEKNAPNVLKLKEQFTEKQFLTAKEKYGHKVMADYLVRMHNWKDLSKKKVSAYLTMTSWINKDQK